MMDRRIYIRSANVHGEIQRWPEGALSGLSDLLQLWICLLSNCSSYRLGYLMHAQSVYLEPFNHFLGLFTATGLVNKWIDDALFVLQLEREVASRKHIRTKSNILTLKHLQTAFYILFIGIALSLGVFIAELCWGKRNGSGGGSN